jgi:hypothetical protein
MEKQKPIRSAIWRQRLSEAQRGEKGSNWKGGRFIKHGYVHLPDHPFASKDHYVMEHRYVMEQHLGRYLTKKEVVHHINENKSDNRLENLELFPTRGAHLHTRHEFVHTPEMNEKTSIRLRGEKNHNWGKPLSEERKKRQSIAMTGRHPSEETKKKLSEAMKKRVLGEEHKRRIGEAPQR